MFACSSFWPRIVQDIIITSSLDKASVIMFAAMFGAGFVATLWFLSACTTCPRRLRMQAVQSVIQAMDKDEKQSLRSSLRKQTQHHGHDEGHDSDSCSSDSWSVVLTKNDASPMQSVLPELPPLEKLSATQKCQQKRTTALGSNQFGRQVRCKDCQELLVKSWYPKSNMNIKVA